MDKPDKYICQRKHCEWRNGAMCIRMPCPYGCCFLIKTEYVNQINEACGRVDADDRGKAGTVPGIKTGNLTA